MSSRLLQAFLHHAEDYPEDVALRDTYGQSNHGDHVRTIRWSQLVRTTARLRARLKAHAPVGATVIMAIANRIEFHIAFLAALAADMNVFVISPKLTETELRRAASVSEARCVIADQSICDTLAADTDYRIPLSDVWLPSSDEGPVEDFLQTRCQGSLFLHSSGTTGEPKIVRRTADSLDAVAANCVQAVGFTFGDRALLTVPLHHSYGIEHGLFAPIFAGSAVDLFDTFDPAQIGPYIADHPITHLPGVPFIFEALVQSTPGQAQKAHWLKRVYSAGGPLPPSVFDGVQRITGLQLGQVYGSTEVGSVTFNDPDLPGFDSTSVGRPMTGVDIRILDQDAPNVHKPLNQGEAGQVAIHGPSMLAGYVGQTVDPTDAGFFLTGDLGWLDPHGALHLTGRANLLINIGGRKVNPSEIEAVLHEHPGVSEAVVLPVEVTPTVSRIRAVIVPQPGSEPSESQLRRHVKSRLSGYKVPRSFEWVHDLPRSATGKVLRDAVE